VRKAVAGQHVAQLAYAFGIAVKIRKRHYSPRGHREITNHCNPSAEVTSERCRVRQNPHKTLSFRPTRSAASRVEEPAFAGSGSQSRDEVFTPATPLIFPPASASATQLP